MLVRLRDAQTRLLPHGWVDVVRQVLLFAVAYYGYSLVRGAVSGQDAAAFAHARGLISVERSLHVFVEPTIQAWASSSHLLITTATWIYIHAQTSVVLGALAYLYLFHNRSFYFVRNMFMAAMVIALISYVLFPTAPPRFLPEWGFFDSVSDFTGIPPESHSVNAFFNQYAAVPSMHVGFATIIGVTLARVVRPRALRVLWLAYPLLITFVTVVTGNHFLADAFLGVLTAGLSAAAACWLGRARPQVWRFEPVVGPDAGAAGATAGAPA